MKTPDGYRYDAVHAGRQPAPLTLMTEPGSYQPLEGSVDQVRARLSGLEARLAAVERAIEELRRLAGWSRE